MLKEKIYTINELVEATELKHVAIIMDGNRRWAKKHNLPTTAGHKKGVESLKNIVKLADDYGIKYITAYAFSTENWKRTQEEVSFLMKLIAETLKNELGEMLERGVKIKIIGDFEPLDDTLKKVLNNAMEKSKDNQGVILQIAINYGSKNEILSAVKKIAQKIEAKELSVEDISEDTISENLYTAGIPDPDILVRPGGEYRISNYLLWQIAYSEIYITDKFWPEYGKDEFEETIREFARRSRRFGG